MPYVYHCSCRVSFFHALEKGFFEFRHPSLILNWTQLQKAHPLPNDKKKINFLEQLYHPKAFRLKVVHMPDTLGGQ